MFVCKDELWECPCTLSRLICADFITFGLIREIFARNITKFNLHKISLKLSFAKFNPHKKIENGWLKGDQISVSFYFS